MNNKGEHRLMVIGLLGVYARMLRNRRAEHEAHCEKRAVSSTESLDPGRLIKRVEGELEAINETIKVMKQHWRIE
jgi:hypothetical protein